MKRLILFLACGLLALGVQAQSRQTLTVNGETVEKTVVKMTFEGDQVVLHFADKSQQAADMSGVVLSFAIDNSTIIGSLQGKVYDVLHIANLEPGTEIVVYDAHGKVVMTTVAEQATADLQARSLRGGVYLLKAGRQVVKFVKN